MPVGSKPFFGGANVLLFHRVDDENVYLTNNVNDPAGNVLGTRDARFGVMPGFEVFLGRYFNCGRNAITASYWGLFPEDEMATVTTAGGVDLRSRYHFNDVTMPAIGIYPLAPVYDWYDDAVAHRVDRRSEFHNIEVNLLGFMTGGAARTFYLPTAGTLFSGTRGARAALAAVTQRMDLASVAAADTAVVLAVALAVMQAAAVVLAVLATATRHHAIHVAAVTVTAVHQAALRLDHAT